MGALHSSAFLYAIQEKIGVFPIFEYDNLLVSLVFFNEIVYQWQVFLAELFYLSFKVGIKFGIDPRQVVSLFTKAGNSSVEANCCWEIK